MGAVDPEGDGSGATAAASVSLVVADTDITRAALRSGLLWCLRSGEGTTANALRTTAPRLEQEAWEEVMRTNMTEDDKVERAGDCNEQEETKKKEEKTEKKEEEKEEEQEGKTEEKERESGNDKGNYKNVE